MDPTSDGIVFTMTLGSHKASLIDTSAILNLFFGARRLQRVRRATDIVSLSNAPKLCYKILISGQHPRESGDSYNAQAPTVYCSITESCGKEKHFD